MGPEFGDATKMSFCRFAPFDIGGYLGSIQPGQGERRISQRRRDG